VKRFLSVLVIVAIAFAILGCVSQPKEKEKPSKMNEPVAYPPKLLEHKGTAWGANPPNWLLASLKGYKEVEKMPEYAGKFVVIVEATGASQEGAELAASRLDAQPRIAALISTRVKDTFAGAQVGDKDKIETYMERCVKSVAEANFTGFLMEDSWWAQFQTYTPEGKPDKRDYRVIQLWTISKDILQKQIDKILQQESAAEPKTPEKQRAMDLVQESFYDGF
jgi:hypothetical protein